ncbi:MAG: DUF3352 domain-containing protein, partial [Thermoleophilia bacterium]|nr:DUF3352 domain-containing protein [Thermoleophilia bacterium]
ALRDHGPGSGTWTAWLRRSRQRAGGAWRRLEATTRHRIAAVAIVAAVVALIWLVLVPAAPCGLPGGDSCPPGDDAIALVPEDALAYVHLDVDPESERFAAVADIGGRVPLLSRLAVGALTGLTGIRFDYERQIEPWAGGEIALAALPAGRSGQRVLMVEAADEEAADRFASELLGPRQSTASVAGVDVAVGRGDTAWAIDGGFLLLGSRTGLTAMLEAGGSLEGSAGADVLDELPEDRVATAYLSADGARTLLWSGGGLGVLEPLVQAAATEGAAASLGADADGLHLAIRSDLDPARAEDRPGVFTTLPRFTPALTASIGPRPLAYLGLGDPDAGIGALLDQARTSSPGLLTAFRRATGRLGRDAGVDLIRDVLPLLGDEAALSLQPVAIGSEASVPGVAAGAGTPYASLVSSGVDPEAARRSLARLEPAVERAAGPDGGREATFESIQLAGVQARSLVVSDAVDLTYAAWDDRLVIATDSLGIEQARSPDGGLEDSERFRELTDGMPEEVSLIAYLDLGGLLDLGEQAGLAVDPDYAALAPDLRAVTAAALTVVGGKEEIDTDLRIAVGPRQVPEIDPSPFGE